VSRDYHRRADTRSRKSTPGWVWFAVGFIAGAFSVGLAWLRLEPADVQALTAGLTAPAQPAAPAAEDDERNAVPKPQFQFYSLLPGMEVVVPDDEVDRRSGAAPAQPAAPTPPPAATPPPAVAAATPAPPPAAKPADEVLMLQVAAYKNGADAEGLKARIALRGLEAVVQSVTIDKETFYRVRLGPYRGIEQLQGARERLKKNGYDSVVVRLK